MNLSLAALDWHKFLARPRLDHPPPEALNSLVTGAGGSIGTALALGLAQLGTSHLALLEKSESNLLALERTVLDALRSACDQRNIAAALEFLRMIVPEYTPSTAIVALAAPSALRVAP